MFAFFENMSQQIFPFLKMFFSDLRQLAREVVKIIPFNWFFLVHVEVLQIKKSQHEFFVFKLTKRSGTSFQRMHAHRRLYHIFLEYVGL